MNPLFIISKVEIYEKPITFNIRPEWYHIKKLDHKLPDDIQILFYKYMDNRLKIEKDGITFEGKTYYKDSNNWDYVTIVDNKMINVESKDAPQDVRIMFHDRTPFSDGIRSSETNHLYIFEHGSKDKLGYVPNRDLSLSKLYDDMLPYIQKLDNLVGKPIKMEDLKKNLHKDLRFRIYDFKIYSGESSGGRMSVITPLITYCKLHLTDTEGHEIIKMCECCNSFSIQDIE
jgi:hypothetical protein